MSDMPTKMASKPVNLEFIQGLEVMENQVYPLQGAYGERQARDPRLSLYVGAGMPQGNTVCYYEHMVTVRHTPTQIYYIVFRQTKDAQLMEQNDPIKHPKWLMDHAVKDDERSIYIHQAKQNAPKLLAKGVSNIGEWLDEIKDETVFESLAYFLIRSGTLPEKFFGKAR